MNSKQIFKNQDLFSFTFLDKEFENPNAFKIHLNSDYLVQTAEMVKEMPDNRMDTETYAAYRLSMDVGQTFFYFAFLAVMPYQKRVDFLNWQLAQCDDKMSFLHRVEALSQADYWYRFDEFSYYKPEAEKLVADWVIAKYQGKELAKPLTLIKP